MAQAAVEITERNGDEKSKVLRRKGEIPGVIYGQNLDDSVPIKITNMSLLKLLRNNSKGSIVKLNLNGKTNNYLVKQVQKNPLTGGIIHVDFQQVSKNEIVKMKIPVEYEGIEALKAKRLNIAVTISEVEMQGDAEKIPEYIKIDASKMDYGHKIFVSDIDLPEGVKFLTNPDAILATVTG